MRATHTVNPKDGESEQVLDVVLIGGGIMSATLGAMFAKLQPDWSVVMFERLGRIAAESSNAWNNAGTGHSGLCELNYMPDPHDPRKAEQIAGMFQLSRQFWASLVSGGDIADPASFIHATPHMDVVFGARDVAYLRRRFDTLRSAPLFSAMRYSEDPETIAAWAPLLMAGRDRAEPVAATRYDGGTDIDFGALTGTLTEVMTRSGARVRVGHEVRELHRGPDGLWTVSGRVRDTGRRFGVRAKFVFVGAGGYALTLLQKARIPEVRGCAVFPFGAQFLRTDNPAVVGRHDAKVYGRAALGAPPMSVPHMDKRVVDGRESVLFGPYATFSTRLLTHGRLLDLFSTLRGHNIAVLVAAGMQNLPLVRYLIGQLLATRRAKFAQLQRFYPDADPADWSLITAGQRAQLIKPDARRVGVLTFGTEVVTGAESTIAGLLGASPGASTAPAIMIDVLAQCFPHHASRWEPILHAMMPAVTSTTVADRSRVDADLAATAQALGLTGPDTAHRTERDIG